MSTRNNLDNAVLSISRVGTFSDGEKDALIKAFRTSGFPGNFVLTSPAANEVLRFDGTDWINAAGGAVNWTDLLDTPGSITASGFVKGNVGGTGLEMVTNVAEVDASETISGAWNYTTAPTVSGNALLTATSIIDNLSDVDTTGKISGDFLMWNGVTWVDQTLSFDYFAPMTDLGDIIYGEGQGVGTRLGVGTAGQVLTVTAGKPAWETPASGFANPLTTRGDIIYRDATITTRLGLGASGTYLRSNGTDASWTAPTFAETSPMTTNEDIIKQSGGVATRLPVGTNDQVLTVSAGVVGWATPVAGFTNPMTTRGDLIYMDATTTTNRLGIGAAGYVLTSNGTDVSWAAAAGGGATAFTDLTDTPSSYTGQALKWLRVNTGATALEFTAAPVTTVTGAGAISSSGGTTPIISIAAATALVPGTMSAADYSKLAGIESAADKTDAANVDAAGAIMDGNYSADGFQVRLTSTTYTTRILGGTSPINVSNGDGQAGHPYISINAASTTGSGAVELATTTETNAGADATRAVTPSGLAGWTGSASLSTLASTITIGGTMTAAAFNATSARDKKTEIPWFMDIAQLQYLRPIAYKLKDDETATVQLGYYADEVATIFPEVVAFDDGKAAGIDYSRLVVPAIAKINEQERTIESLRDLIEDLTVRVNRLEYEAGLSR